MHFPLQGPPPPKHTTRGTREVLVLVGRAETLQLSEPRLPLALPVTPDACTAGKKRII